VTEERRTSDWGIDLTYQDAFGKWHETAEETIQAILQAMGGDATAMAPMQDESVVVVRKGEQREMRSGGTISLEDGQSISFEHRLPPDLPTGYHQVLIDGTEKPARLIVSPGKCWLPEALNTWGWAVQLYAARSRESWGIGDFGDLARLATWSKELGAGMMLLNPLSAATPILPQQPSPYFPASRRFFNPLWIHVPGVTGAAAGLGTRFEEIARAGQLLNNERQIDRDKVFELKMSALETLWLGFKGDAEFERFCQEQGSDLHRFATFCALAEQYQSGWHSWPAAYQHPSSPSVAQFGKENESRIRFHSWLQWVLDQQLASCAQDIALMQDLPIGVDPDGADAWAWQDVIATGAGVGAPPDEFNTQGQSWGLPPFIPHRLRAAGYEPFIQTIRAGFRHGGGLRIDHVMGLFRLFWIPQGMTAAQGAYVRYDADEMLAIVALESERAKACVVGEDLGTVEESARDKLSAHNILSYRLLWFEKNHPRTYPREALAAVTTHDLPTIAGLWTGSDLAKQEQIELKPNKESTDEICKRLRRLTNLTDKASVNEVIERTYEKLAQAPCRIVTAALDDAAEVEERPNIPATMGEQNPNWSLALPISIEELMERQLPQQIASVLKREGPVTRTIAAD